MAKFSKILQLKDMLQGLENDLGLSELPEAQKLIVIAADDLRHMHEQVLTTEQLRVHRLIKSMSKPAFQRALRALVAAGVLKHANGSRAKHYVLDLAPLKQ